MEFVARVLVQIPDPKRHLVRCCGASRGLGRSLHRGTWRELAFPAAEEPPQQPQPGCPDVRRGSWRAGPEKEVPIPLLSQDAVEALEALDAAAPLIQAAFGEKAAGIRKLGSSREATIEMSSDCLARPAYESDEAEHQSSLHPSRSRE